MKTTIEIPDDLFLKVKVMAAERRTTLKDLMIQALSRLTQTPQDSVENQRKLIGERLLRSLQASNTEPMVPLTRDEIYDRGLADRS